MAIRLQSKTNVIAPAGSYPYGRIKDDTGGNNGTPVNEAVYGDFHQFFARILDLGGVVGNDLPENSANGFQYIVALIAIIVAQATTLVNAEASTRAANDTTLQNNINSEASARATAVSSEASTRGAADTTLQNNINAEAASRIAADALKSDKAKPAWINLSLINGWDEEGINVSRYRITDQNELEIAAYIASGSVSSSVFANLPNGTIASTLGIDMAIVNSSDGSFARLAISGGSPTTLQIPGHIASKSYAIFVTIPLDAAS